LSKVEEIIGLLGPLHAVRMLTVFLVCRKCIFYLFCINCRGYIVVNEKATSYRMLMSSSYPGMRSKYV